MPTNWQRVSERFGLGSVDKAQVKCPCHDDRVKSLSVKRKGDDVLVWCFAGCKFQTLKDELGLQSNGAPNSPHAYVPPSRRVVAEYRYRDLAGDVVAIKQRWGPVKTFTWLALYPDGQMRQNFPEGMGQGDLPLYRLPEAHHASKNGLMVAIVEGEKDVDTLHALGIAAVTNPGGASGGGNAYDATHYTPYFKRGASFVIIPDNDEPGRKHAQRLADALAPTFRIQVCHMPNVPEKGDVSDWVAIERQGGVDDDAIRDRLTRLLIDAPPHTAPNVTPDGLPVAPIDPDAFIERAAIYEYDAGWSRADAERVALASTNERATALRASLSAPERLMLETDDPELREIYRKLAR